jgi:hypothetical protein
LRPHPASTARATSGASSGANSAAARRRARCGTNTGILVTGRWRRERARRPRGRQQRGAARQRGGGHGGELAAAAEHAGVARELGERGGPRPAVLRVLRAGVEQQRLRREQVDHGADALLVAAARDLLVARRAGQQRLARREAVGGHAELLGGAHGLVDRLRRERVGPRPRGVGRGVGGLHAGAPRAAVEQRQREAHLHVVVVAGELREVAHLVVAAAARDRDRRELRRARHAHLLGGGERVAARGVEVGAVAQGAGDERVDAPGERRGGGARGGGRGRGVDRDAEVRVGAGVDHRGERRARVGLLGARVQQVHLRLPEQRGRLQRVGHGGEPGAEARHRGVAAERGGAHVVALRVDHLPRALVAEVRLLGLQHGGDHGGVELGLVAVRRLARGGHAAGAAAEVEQEEREADGGAELRALVEQPVDAGGPARGAAGDGLRAREPGVERQQREVAPARHRRLRARRLRGGERRARGGVGAQRRVEHVGERERAPRDGGGGGRRARRAAAGARRHARDRPRLRRHRLVEQGARGLGLRAGGGGARA